MAICSSRQHNLFIVGASLALANLIAFLTLAFNRQAGLYGPEADSILPPLVEGLLLSFQVMALLGTALYLPQGRPAGGLASVTLCGMAGVLAAVFAAGWAEPGHYPMVLAFAAVALLCGLLATRQLRRLTDSVHEPEWHGGV
ncbi:MAG: hypothetical protein AB1899_07650 [Pseudomonadota bacterium]